MKKNNSLAVAFSGGVDSTFLLAVAKKVFSAADQPFLAVTASSPLHSADDISDAVMFAKENNIPHQVVQTHEMTSRAFVKNSSDRCYICKKIIFQQIIKAAQSKGIAAVAHGVNLDDAGDYRPGLKAAQEMGILSPLLEAGLTKNDIRLLSREMGLPTWDKPSSGCLATRIPYGEPVTAKKMQMVEASEKVLYRLGFTVCRVRNYGETAKIEVPAGDIEKLLDPSMRGHIIREFKNIGFLYIVMDLEGFASGRLNRSVSV